MTRRKWIAGLPAASLAGESLRAAHALPKAACILDVYSPNSHADVFISRLLDGYRLNGAWHAPRLITTSFYVDQVPYNDMAREQAAEYGIRIAKSVEEAIEGADGIAVIGEHGNYPRSPLGNVQYPRKRYFDAITGAFERGRRVKPLLNDKYLAWDWADADSMWARVREMRIPFLCGSTLPLTWRRPPVEFGDGTEFEELAVVSCGDLEEHAYHGVELLQSIAEGRRGGESGVESVRYAEGDEVWRIAPDLREAALKRRVNPPPENLIEKPEAFQIRYRDGLRAAVLNLNASSRDYLLAARIKGERAIQATCFFIQLYTHTHWGFMVRAFENLVLTGREVMPPERTLMANGVMLAGLESRKRGGTWVDTPHLAFAYSWPRR